MEKEMLEMFIYQLLSVREPQWQSLSECIWLMDYTLKIIDEESIEAWNSKISEPFSNWSKKHNGQEHPVQILQKELMKLSEEQYVETLKKAREMMIKYRSDANDYYSIYCIKSKQDAEELVEKILIRNIDSIEELQKKINEKLEEDKNNNNSNNKKEISLLSYELAKRYYINKDYTNALKGFNSISDYNNDAKYMIGVCYYYGRGVEKDLQKAYNINKELMNIDEICKYQVAESLLFGEGTERNYEEAFKLFNELIGHLPYDTNYGVKCYLGRMYFYGNGTKQDKQKGFELLDEAWSSGYVKLNYKLIKKVIKEYYNISE